MNDDHALVESVLASERGAFERLIHRHQRMVWHMLLRMVRNPADADELAQETFLRVHRSLPQFRYESSLSTWIGQIAFSQGSRFLRRKSIPLVDSDETGAVMDEIGDDVDFTAALADADLYRHVAAAIERLPTIQRTLLTLCHLEEQTITDAAAITGLPTGTIKSHLFRARARLRAEIEALTASDQPIRVDGVHTP